MAISFRRRSFNRVLAVVVLGVFFRLVFFSPSSQTSSLFTSESLEIQEHNVLERVRPDKTLNVQKHKFLQVRMGRDDRDDLLGEVIRDGVMDYWERFQKP